MSGKEKIEISDDPSNPDSGEEMFAEVDYGASPEKNPLWFKQFMNLEPADRRALIKRILDRIKKSKPEAYRFIKYHANELVGLSPDVRYAMAGSQNDDDLDVKWVHGFGAPTLCLWSKSHGFAILINENLDYDDTVLNRVKGNKRTSLKGFTG